MCSSLVAVARGALAFSGVPDPGDPCGTFGTFGTFGTEIDFVRVAVRVFPRRTAVCCGSTRRCPPY
jgi:hypothetical protein